MSQSGNNESAQREKPMVDVVDERYKNAVELVQRLREELIALFHKSQESFEIQLSFISAGALPCP